MTGAVPPNKEQRTMAAWRGFFVLAGLYNIAGGAWGFFHLEASFRDLGLPPPTYSFAFELLFLAVISLGVAYLAVARDPLRHRPLVWLGAATKLEGAAISFWAIQRGQLPASSWWQPVVNDLLWLLGFVAFQVWARGRPARSPT